MAKREKATLPSIRTRHITCFYCTAVSLLILSIVLFVLANGPDQAQAFGGNRSKTPVIVSASIILILSIVIVIWITYYTINYCRLKKQNQQRTILNNNKNIITASTTTSIEDETIISTIENRDDRQRRLRNKNYLDDKKIPPIKVNYVSYDNKAFSSINDENSFSVDIPDKPYS
ncbi:unnamed protein product [Didymodactylos carnosus]|uniref:Uncharacterized protein n=1 Tax=Didymodactylos carnosus TaxID=1234261 RepID=A0A814HUA0_9BILA|nr:unnamed protein product [Didymodactylos carnosus]CAF1234783.1 unnamed protein product [Didymodactylos carnosus]CAF3786046.1 unnamed protein product [Didymodactylos carnosus]CAF4042769.1 unnamed protein product [Didymodactylos carnosus]